MPRGAQGGRRGGGFQPRPSALRAGQAAGDEGLRAALPFGPVGAQREQRFLGGQGRRGGSIQLSPAVEAIRRRKSLAQQARLGPLRRRADREYPRLARPALGLWALAPALPEL